MNLDLGSGGTVVLSGLEGAFVNASQVSFVTVRGGLSAIDTIFCDSSGALRAIWNDTVFSVSFTVCAGRVFRARDVYVVSFNVTNPLFSQQSPSTSIEGRDSNFEIARSLIVKGGGTLFGVLNGTSPLYIVVPEFTEKQIFQSLPLAGALNEITILLRSSLHIKAQDGAVIYIQGLENVVASATVDLRFG
eukprot:1000841-Rhodomonas_salina.1